MSSHQNQGYYLIPTHLSLSIWMMSSNIGGMEFFEGEIEPDLFNECLQEDDGEL